MLPSFYHELLQKYLTPAQLLTLQMLVWLLQSQKEVRIERLAATLQLPILQSSRRRHIQRFLKIKALSILILWFPIVKQVISRQLLAGSQLVIALDRTQWKEHNVLMVSAIVQKRAFPIFWTLLEKKGASNLAEQQQVLRPVIRLWKRYKLVIIGDREFHSIELAQWLHRQHLSFVLRQKGNTTFREKKQPFCSLDTIPVQPGIHLLYPKISLTKKKGFSRFNLVASGQRKYRSQQEDEPWYLLTNLQTFQARSQFTTNVTASKQCLKTVKQEDIT
ncbi:MAG TPA: transposase [Phormidium sp.]